MIFQRKITNNNQKITAKENSLAYMIGNLENAVKNLTDTIKVMEEKQEEINTSLSHLEKKIEAVDNRIDIILGENIKKYAQQTFETMSYSEAIDKGWSMTDDGFWIPPQDNETAVDTFLTVTPPKRD